jgi:hypothetical protein
MINRKFIYKYLNKQVKKKYVLGGSTHSGGDSSLLEGISKFFMIGYWANERDVYFGLFGESISCSFLSIARGL